MKKKALTIALLGLLLIGAIIPVSVSVSAAETWNYGINKSVKPNEWYNHYYHSSARHYGTITRKGVTYFGPVANAGGWSRLNLVVIGPYKATYHKFIL